MLLITPKFGFQLQVSIVRMPSCNKLVLTDIASGHRCKMTITTVVNVLFGYFIYFMLFSLSVLKHTLQVSSSSTSCLNYSNKSHSSWSLGTGNLLDCLFRLSSDITVIPANLRNRRGLRELLSLGKPNATDMRLLPQGAVLLGARAAGEVQPETGL